MEELIGIEEVARITSKSYMFIYNAKGFPGSVTQSPKKWSRADIMRWVSLKQPRGLDCDMAQAFIRRPALKEAL